MWCNLRLTNQSVAQLTHLLCPDYKICNQFFTLKVYSAASGAERQWSVSVAGTRGGGVTPYIVYGTHVPLE